MKNPDFLLRNIPDPFPTKLPLMTWSLMVAGGALSGRHSYWPLWAVVRVWRRSETTVTSDLSTRRLTPDW